MPSGQRTERCGVQSGDPFARAHKAQRLGKVIPWEEAIKANKRSMLQGREGGSTRGREPDARLRRSVGNGRRNDGRRQVHRRKGLFFPFRAIATRRSLFLQSPPTLLLHCMATARFSCAPLKTGKDPRPSVVATARETRSFLLPSLPACPDARSFCSDASPFLLRPSLLWVWRKETRLQLLCPVASQHGERLLPGPVPDAANH